MKRKPRYFLALMMIPVLAFGNLVGREYESGGFSDLIRTSISQ